MRMQQFRKKPIVIEAMRLLPETCMALCEWMGVEHEPEPGARCGIDSPLIIWTLEGEMRADPGDWVIRGIKGEFYPCKADIFEATYEPVQEVSE